MATSRVNLKVYTRAAVHPHILLHGSAVDPTVSLLHSELAQMTTIYILYYGPVNTSPVCNSERASTVIRDVLIIKIPILLGSG